MYQILITALVAGIIAQLSKFLIKTNNIKFNWRSLSSYSGMPSSHAAFVAALTTIVGLTQGFSSPLFAVCFIFSVLIIRDAIGLRRYLGQHGEIINILVKDLAEDKMLDQSYPKLLEKIGHTPAQIIAGSALGIFTSLASYLFF
ncbi:MAG: divergent PAP2 family protein [Patescibacteria group bacterium]|nr:divergent PAP2 family protein [Patescibacteria group bacterium]